MPRPVITPAFFTHSVFGVTGFSDGANFTGSVFSTDGGPPLAAVTSAPAGHCVYRSAGIDGWPALEFNATGGLFGGNATLQSYTNNTAGAGTDKPWTIAWRASISVINATNHTLCLSSSTDADPFLTCGPQFTNPTSSWQARRRDDNTNTGGGLGVLVSGSSTGVHSFVAVFDGTNISLYVDGTMVGSATAASSANAYTITQMCWAVLFRQTNGTPIGSPGNCLMSKSLVADDAVNSTDRGLIETWLAEPPDPVTGLVYPRPKMYLLAR